MGVVHRNISADNIITNTFKFNTKSYIIDFKFANFQGKKDFLPKAGTPGFMAPETII
jgi:serine/threonine protein kinase